jgi:hypothetical protein
MIARAWRKGRSDKVYIKVFYYEGSVEENIWKATQTKVGLAELFFNLVKTIRDEG